MGTSEATNRFLPATVQCLSTPDAQLRRSNSVSISASHTRCNKRNAKRRTMSIQQFPVTDHSLHKCRLSRQVICYSQQPESDKNGNKTWFGDIMSGLNVISDMLIGANTVEFGEVKEKSDCRDATNSIVEEAWELLRESVVYYCSGPIGTPAAKADATSSEVLNYDQVFIRDFISSGVAFLLKGEYDIVRNFILHTLQLQSWEKTMDCHSPGQGLMPASFKVKTTLLDGDDESATEEVLDPDFGEAAIGRVAPIDSGSLVCNVAL